MPNLLDQVLTQRLGKELCAMAGVDPGIVERIELVLEPLKSAKVVFTVHAGDMVQNNWRTKQGVGNAGIQGQA